MSGRPHSEGEEFSLYNLEQWCVISPLKGDVLFVNLQSTSYKVDAETWAPFLVMGVELLRAMGTLALEVKYLGGCSPEINREMSSQFNRRPGRLHLCGTTPCLEEEAGTLHVTRLVWHTLQGAEGWLTGRAMRTATAWLQGPGGADHPIDVDEAEDPGQSREEVAEKEVPNQRPLVQPQHQLPPSSPARALGVELERRPHSILSRFND